ILWTVDNFLLLLYNSHQEQLPMCLTIYQESLFFLIEQDDEGEQIERAEGLVCDAT
ncbi:hypothetical protein BG015_011654, partial [Linnemannia schmuckeri]